MGDLEGRLRAEVTRRQREFSPSTGFGDRIAARVRQRRRQRRLAAGLLGAAAAAIAVVGVVVAGPRDEDAVHVGGDQVTSTTIQPPSSTTTTAEATSTTGAPAGAPIGPETPLSRSGIGPVRAGMTLHEAQAAAGRTITPNPPAGPGATCLTAQVEGLDVWFLASLSGEADEDLMDGVVRSVQGGRTTIEGLAIGDPIADANDLYGAPTRTLPYPYLTNGQVSVFESGDSAYSVTTDGVTITEIESGDPEWVANLEGCE
jgi:hypothetical protein